MGERSERVKEEKSGGEMGKESTVMMGTNGLKRNKNKEIRQGGKRRKE